MMSIPSRPTPLRRVPSLGEDVYVKLELAHPSGTLKHRAIPPWLERALATGLLAPAQPVVIRSAGSAAIATAWAGARLGLPVIAVLTPDAGDDVVTRLVALGASCSRVAVDEGEAFVAALCRTRGAYYLRQEREAGLVDFYRPVAREILEALGSGVTIVVGIGTGLSVTGIAREAAPHAGARVVGVEPAEAPIAAGGRWAPHGIAGLAPPLEQPLLERERLSAILPIPSADAHAMAARVLRHEQLAVGASTGATLAGVAHLIARGQRGPFVAIAASAA